MIRLFLLCLALVYKSGLLSLEKEGELAQKEFQEVSQERFQVTWRLSVERVIEGASFTIELEALYPSDYLLDQSKLIEGLSSSLDPFSVWLLQEVKIRQEAVEKSQERKKIHLTFIPLQDGVHTLVLRPLFFSPKADSTIQRRIPYFFTPITLDVAAAPSGTDLSLSPPVALTEEFPLALSLENERLFIENEHGEALNGQAIAFALQKKFLPWALLFFLLGAVVLFWFVLFILKALPERKVHQKKKRSIQERLKELLELVENLPEEERRQAYEKLWLALREFLEESFGGGDRSCLTNVQLAQEVELCQALAPNRKESLLFLLAEIDKVKFAAFHPSKSDWDKFISTFNKILRQ